MSDPLVSIVTPTYNQGRFLRETIESVLEQTYPKVEYIVLDDGSTDHTPRILQEFERSDIVTVVRHQNIGQTATINKGWSMSNGEILAWLNSDDLLAPHAVDAAVDALEENKDVLGVFGDCMRIDEHGQEIGAYPVRLCRLEDLLFEYSWLPIAQQSTFLRRRVLDVVGYLDQQVFYCMDFEYWLRVLTKGKMAYKGGRPWSFSRSHQAAKGHNPSAKKRAALDYPYVYRKYFASPDLPHCIAKRRREGLAVAHWQAASRLWDSRNIKLSFKHILLSLFYCPTARPVRKCKAVVKWFLKSLATVRKFRRGINAS